MLSQIKTKLSPLDRQTDPFVREATPPYIVHLESEDEHNRSIVVDVGKTRPQAEVSIRPHWEHAQHLERQKRTLHSKHADLSKTK